MPFEEHIDDSSSEIKFADINLRSAYLPPADIDGELLFYITEAHRVLRPSIVMMIAGCSRDESHFLQCVKLAVSAFHYPTKAEGFGGDVVDTFREGEDANADNAYNLVMIAAQEAAMPEDDWVHVSKCVKFVMEAME